MEINNLYYGIILYIIIIASLMFTKPNFIYDHHKSKYKEFGTSGDKTIFTLPIIAILLAIIVAIFLVLCSPTKQSQIQSQQNQLSNYQYPHYQYMQQPIQPIQYVPIQYYQQMHQIQQLQPLHQIQQYNQQSNL